MNIHNEIIRCFWSQDLRQYIEETGYLFSAQDLLVIVCRYTPTFDRRLQLLELLTLHCPEISDHARKCIAYQEKCLAAFCSHDPDQVYELQIRDNPTDSDTCEDRYLCKSFDTALEMIDAFYREHPFITECDTVRYRIVRRRILRSGMPFTEDRCGEAILGPGKVLLRVSELTDENELGPCPEFCVDCHIPCVCNLEVSFPRFLSDYSTVQYRLSDGSLHYGIDLSCLWEGPLTECYIIPLDCDALKTRALCEHWTVYAHEHIPVPDVRAVSKNELPEPLLENYRIFTAWLDQNGLF